MTTSSINKGKFKEAIRVAFEGDKHIFDIYCPYVNVKSVEDIVNDISERIGNEFPMATLKGVYHNNELIGYYVYSKDTLISFALNINYRSKRQLREFWSKIRIDIKGSFQCYLWSVNRRGWRWLQKMGMKVVSQDLLLTHLKF